MIATGSRPGGPFFAARVGEDVPFPMYVAPYLHVFVHAVKKWHLGSGCPGFVARELWPELVGTLPVDGGVAVVSLLWDDGEAHTVAVRNVLGFYFSLELRQHPSGSAVVVSTPFDPSRVMLAAMKPHYDQLPIVNTKFDSPHGINVQVCLFAERCRRHLLTN